jgi:hypothetical protein
MSPTCWCRDEEVDLMTIAVESWKTIALRALAAALFYAGMLAALAWRTRSAEHDPGRRVRPVRPATA